jgi:O-antigen/teichoic acid export membrane protein
VSAARKIIQNTGILYGRMILTVGISLYSTRLILQSLGTTDFGIFNLIAGVIAILSFLSTAMATATQRYFSFYQGKDDLPMQTKVFNNSLILHLVLGIGVLVLLEAMGPFLFTGFLNIPIARIDAAKEVYTMMSISVLFTMVSVPFNASLMAHENMTWVAIVNIGESLMKLLAAFIVVEYSGEKLIIYGILNAIISAIATVMYGAYCYKNYLECKFKKILSVDKILIKELFAFASWNLFGVLCGLGRNQGMAVILNLFFGSNINAAYGIANQVSSQLNFFSLTLLRAINPQIIKSEGANDRERMLLLSMTASKFCFFLLAILAVPFTFEASAILKLWLGNVPDYGPEFCSMILIATIANQLTIGLQTAAQAVGRIKVYQTTVGGTLLLSLPFTYLVLKNGGSIYWVFIGYTLFEVIACGLRVIFLKRLAGLSITEFLRRVILKEIGPIIASVAFCLFVTSRFDFNGRFILTFAGSSIVFVVFIFFSGLCTDEKKFIEKLLKDTLAKLSNKKSQLTFNQAQNQ